MIKILILLSLVGCAYQKTFTYTEDCILSSNGEKWVCKLTVPLAIGENESCFIRSEKEIYNISCDVFTYANLDQSNPSY